MSIRSFVRGEREEPIHFYVQPSRINRIYQYKAEIFEEDERGNRSLKGSVWADTKFGLRYAVWEKCHNIKKARRNAAKSDPKPWKVKL